MMDSSPSRMTRAWGADRLCKASKAFSALLSCTTPIMAFKITMNKIKTGSKNSFGFPSMQAMMKEITAAIIRIKIIMSLNWS